MAILKQGLFGPVTGGVGNLVTSTWKGINYVKEKPQKSNKPRTEAQIAVQERFKFINKLIKPLNPFFKAGFRLMANHKTEINVAFSRTSQNAIVGVYPNLQVDLSKITISAGQLPQLDRVEMTQTTTQILELNWGLDAWKVHCAYDDQLMVAIFCPEIELADGFIGGTERADEQRSFKFSSSMIGKEIAVYVGLYSLNQRMASHSQFLGNFIAI